VGDSDATVPPEESLAFPVELAVAELIVTAVGIAVVDEFSSSQSPSSFGSFGSVELVVSFPVMPP
jgi:hypothetical protein